MKIIVSPGKMQGFCISAHRKGKTIGLVPTMGALHEGHLSLIRRARQGNDIVIVSIFVNPVQFGPREDFKKYPRVIGQDRRLCRKEGVDAIFYPGVSQMYPSGYGTYVDTPGLAGALCGKFRPGHFLGVTTVVAKLFNITCPDTAYFGQKDAQQALIIQRMAGDLNLPLKVKIMPVVRHPDGLAMSSRNIYLSGQQRNDAAVLYQSLLLARRLVREGKRDCVAIIRAMRRLILSKKSASIQYVSIVEPETLLPVKTIRKKSLLALAVYFGSTRLIDNCFLLP